MNKVRIGEDVSDLDMRKCVMYGVDIYEDEIQFRLHRPLDVARLLYVKLRLSMHPDLTVQVWWNHFTDEITAFTAGRKNEAEVTFKDKVMARTDKIVYINDLVARFKEQETFLRQ